MPLPDLCVAPYEVDYMAASETLSAPALERVRVESGLYAGSYLVRQFNNGNGFKSVVARSESPNASLIFVSDFEIADWSEIPGRIARGEFCRYLYFDSNYRLTTSVGVHQFELCFRDKSFIRWLISDSFHVDIGRANRDENYRYAVDWKFDTPAASIERDIQWLLNEQDSSFAFAHRWFRLDCREREKRLLLFGNGDVEALKSWIRALVGGMERFDPNITWQLSLKIRMRAEFESDDEYLDDIVDSVKLVSRAGEFRLSARNCSALKELLRHFYPHRNAALQDVLDFYGIDYPNQEKPMVLSFAVTIPIAQDRLEAKFLLRAFLRGKVSSTELAALMGES